MADVLDVQDWRSRVSTRYDARMESSNVVDLGLRNDGTLNTATMITAFLAKFGDGRRLIFPPGLYNLSSAGGIQFTQSNLHIECWGEVIIRQTVTGGRCFVVGAHGVNADAIMFDLNAARISGISAVTGNSTKPGTLAVPVAVPAWPYGAGAVSVAHAAIEHMNGDDLTISGGTLEDWTQSIAFRGSTVDANTRSKNFRVFNTKFNKHDYGIVARQMDGGEIRTVSGTNAQKTTTDAPHLVYISDRVATRTRQLIIADCIERDNASSSGFFVRNVNSPLLSNLKVSRSPRGIEVEYCTDPLIIGCSVTDPIDNFTADAEQALYTIKDCEGGKIEASYGEIPNSVSAYGLVVGITAAAGATQRAFEVVNVTLKTSLNNVPTTTLKPAILLDRATQTIIDGFHYILGGPNSTYPIQTASGTTDTRIVRPKLTVRGTSSPQLLRTIAGSSGAVLEVDKVLWPTWHATNSISDLGSGSQISRVDGQTSGTWTPTLGFNTGGTLTNGTFAPTGITANGHWVRRGDRVTIAFYVRFSANAFTGAGTTFQLGGLPFTAATVAGATSLHWPLVLSHMENVNLITLARSVAGQIAQAGTVITFRQLGDTGVGAVFGPTEIPSGMANIIIAGGGEYQIVEP